MEEIKEASEKAQEIIDKTEASRSIIKKMMQKSFIKIMYYNIKKDKYYILHIVFF